MIKVRTLCTFDDETGATRQARRVFKVRPDQARRWSERGVVELLPGQFAERSPSGLLLERPYGYPVCPYSKVTDAWKDQTVAILGGGPSLTAEQVNACQGRAKVIAINNAYALAPWADLLYFADKRWHGWHSHRPEFKAFAGQIATVDNLELARDSRIHCLRKGALIGLADRPDTVNTGSNSGHQALNLCYLGKVKRVILIGFDMRHVGKRSHWHGGHVDTHGEPRPTPEWAYARVMLPRLATAVKQLNAAGIDVVNATPGTALKCFRLDTLENALKAD